MTALDHMTDEQFERHALEILSRELGLEALARFLRLTRSARSDYTRHRHAWQDALTLDEILASLRRRPESPRNP